MPGRRPEDAQTWGSGEYQSPITGEYESPMTVAYAQELTAGNGHERFDFTLELLLRGLDLA